MIDTCREWGHHITRTCLFYDAMLGLSMGPITGQGVAELVLGKRPSLDLAPFQVERFSA